MAESAEKKAESPEPQALTEKRLVEEAMFRFGVEPYIVQGAIAGQMRGDTMTLDRAQKLVDAHLKVDGNMEESE